MLFGEKIGETCSTLGVGAYTLGGAFGTFRTWRTVFPSGKVVPYLATNQTGSIWEIGFGTFTQGIPSDTISRTLVASSTSTLINWSITPYYLMSVPVAFVLSFLAGGNAAVARPAWLEQGGTWQKYVDAASWTTGSVIDYVYDGVADIEKGRYEAAADIYVTSPRSYWIDKGAAGHTQTAADIGRTFTFDCTAGARTVALLAGDTAGLKHGFSFFVLGYGSNVNGVILDPAGSEVIDNFPAGANVTIPPKVLVRVMWDGAALRWRTNYDWTARAPIKGYISPGATYANNVTDAVNDIDVAAVTVADDTGAVLIVVPALTKQLDAAWAAGTNQGGRDTGAIANGWWAIWAIGRTDQSTNAGDILLSTSGTAPTMPANYSYKRLLGWVYRASATLVPFKTYERNGDIELEWTTPLEDVSIAFTNSRQTFSLVRTPPASVLATIAVWLEGVGVGTVTNINISNPAQADGTVSATGPAWVSMGMMVGASLSGGAQVVNSVNWSTVMTQQVRTDASGQVAGESTANPPSGNVRISVAKFEISRRA